MAGVSLKKDFRDGDKLYGQQLNNNFGAIEAALGAMNQIVWQDDVDESVTAFRGTTEEIEERDIIDGQLLYDTETGETYIDYNGERISTGSGNSIHIGSDTPENDATQIWIDPTEDANVIGTEVVNSLNGNETHKAPSVAAVNDKRLKKLWENNSPTSSFGTQNIELSSSDYDYLIWIYRFHTGDQNDIQKSQMCIKGSGVLMDIAWDYGVSGNYYAADYYRKATYTDTTHYAVGECSVKYNNTSSATGNNYAIPVVVLGGKF